jgi:hypothetical protein
MSFKMKGASFYNDDQQDNFNEVINSMNIVQKNLEDGVIAEANLDGSTYVDDDIELNTIEGKKALAHEQIHHDQMQGGDMWYDEDFVYWKGTIYPRKTMNEGSKYLPWEKEAYDKEEDMFDRMFNKNA